MADNTEGARLYNCRTALMPPVWTLYDALELGGCRDHDGHTEGGVSAAEAEFFTVYGRGAEGSPDEGLADAITDTPVGATLEEARALLAELAAISGLPAHECGFLEAPPC